MAVFTVINNCAVPILKSAVFPLGAILNADTVEETEFGYWTREETKSC